MSIAVIDEINCIRKIGMHFLKITVITFVAIAGIHMLNIQIDFTLIITMIYFFVFMDNVVLSIIHSRKTAQWNQKLFTLGLISYFVCDLNVGVFNLQMYVNLSTPFFHMLYEFATIAMWLFYLPGIVLITLSNDLLFMKHKC